MLVCPFCSQVELYDYSNISSPRLVKKTNMKSYSSFEKPFDSTSCLTLVFLIADTSKTHTLSVSESIKTRKCVPFNKHDKEVLTVCYSEKNHWLLTSGRDACLVVNNAWSNKLRIKKKLDNTDNVYNIRMSEDSKNIFAGVNSRGVVVYCSKTFDVLRTLSFVKNVFCMTEAEGKLYYSGWVKNQINKVSLGQLMIK